MSAPSLSIQQKFKTVRNKAAKQSNSAKTVLHSPYAVTWPTVQKETAEEILKELDRAFGESSSAFLKSDEYLEMTKKKRMKKKQRMKLSKAEKKAMKEDRLEVLEAAKQQLLSPHDINLKNQVILGLQRVTKHLERDMLRLVLVDRETKPILHQHLPTLSAVRKCPAGAIRGLVDRLRPRVGFISLGAIGFKKLSEGDSDQLSSMVDFIAGKLPLISYKIPGPDTCTTTSMNNTSVSTTEGSGTDLKGISKPQTVVSPAGTSETSTQESLYVYKATGEHSFICLEENEIEDVTSDQEDDETVYPHVPHDEELPEEKSTKRKHGLMQTEQKTVKKRKQSGLVPAKMGRMQSNENRKKTKKGRKRKC